MIVVDTSVPAWKEIRVTGVFADGRIASDLIFRQEDGTDEEIIASLNVPGALPVHWGRVVALRDRRVVTCRASKWED